MYGHKKIIAIDVADPGVVKRTRGSLLKIIKKYADVVFANEEEIFCLTGKKQTEGLKELCTITKTGVVKIGKEGALVGENGQISKIKGFKVNAVDTTGAGDMFAAGFLFGITHNYNTEQSALIGNFAASKVVQQLGARVSCPLKDEIQHLFK